VGRRIGDELTLLTRVQNVGEAAEPLLQELVDDGAGVLFATAMNQRSSALRIRLKHPEVPVLCCSPLVERSSLSTYNARMYEGLFLTGILAGQMTRSDRVGLVAKSREGWLLPCDINAFAEGARLVNPRAEVYLVYLESGDKCRNPEEARWRLFEAGADVILTGALNDGPVRNRLPLETVLALCKLGEKARIEEYYAAVTVSWTRFYRKLAQQLLEGTLDSYAPGDPTHYRWGLREGTVEVLMANRILGPSPVRMVQLFRDLICRNELQIFSALSAEVPYGDLLEQKELLPWVHLTAEHFPER